MGESARNVGESIWLRQIMKYQYYYVEIINLYFHELLCCERCYIRSEIVIMIPCSERIEFTFEIKISHQNSNALPHCGGEHKFFGGEQKF